MNLERAGGFATLQLRREAAGEEWSREVLLRDDDSTGEGEGRILCRRCQSPVTSRAELVSIGGSRAHRRTNPNGYEFEFALVRLALLAQLIDDLGLDGNAMLEDLNPAEKIVGAPVMELNRNLRQIAADDFRFVPKIAKAILTWPLGGLGRFSELIGWQDDDFKPFGTVFNWRESLLGRAPLIPEQSLRAPRLIASGAVAAWAEIVGIADEIQLTEQRCKLAEILPSIITGSREEGTRSASALPTGQVQNYGNQLADWLLEIDPGGL